MHTEKSQNATKLSSNQLERPSPRRIAAHGRITCTRNGSPQPTCERHMYVCMYVCICLYMYVFMYVFMYGLCYLRTEELNQPAPESENVILTS